MPILITATIPPRETFDWTEEIARSAVGRPATRPGQGNVIREVIGRINAARISEKGELVLDIQLDDGTPTGSVALEVKHDLKNKIESVLSVGIQPDLSILSLSPWEKL
jgi:hypothetical protein